MINRDGGLVVTGYINTTDANDTYPTHLNNLGKGGVHTTIDITARDAISVDRRSEGMLCYVETDSSMYQLVGGIENTNWILIYNILNGIINFNITCPTDYVLIGDYDNKVIASPLLLDTRLDIVEMRKADVILGHKNHKFPTAQVLNNFDNGFVYTTDGNISTYPIIPLNKLPTLNATTITIGPFEYGIREMWQGSENGTEASYDVWTSLISTLYTLKTTKWVINKGGFLPDEISFPFAQFISDLPVNRILTHTTDGIIGVASLTHRNLWQGDENNIPIEVSTIGVDNLFDVTYKNIIIGDENNRPIIKSTIYIDNLFDVTYKNIIIGDENNRPIIKSTIYIDNLPDLGISTNPLYLGKGQIWRGTSDNRPIVSDDLSSLEIDVAFIKNITIPAIEADITALQGQVSIIEATLYTPITGLVSVVTGLAAAVAVIQGQVIGIFSTLDSHGSRLDTLETDVENIQTTLVALGVRIDNLRLNNIIADDDVSFYNFKLINLADPVNQTDGVNLRTLQSYIGNIPTNITLDGDVTGLGSTGSTITTTLELTLDEIKLAENTVNLNNNRITNLKDTISDTSDAISYELLVELLQFKAEEIWQV